MGKVKDMTGKQFGRWTVICFAGFNNSGAAMWQCVCECGTVRDVNGYTLRSGRSTCCGCKTYEAIRNKQIVGYYKHGGKKERLYGIWHGIKDRCNNINSPQYPRYGGRGITVCEEWQNNYESFREWAISTGYDPSAKKYDCTLDRIDNNKGYSPDNCEWRNMKAQSNNRSTNHIIEYDGQSHTIQEWAEIIGINSDTLLKRIDNYGWTVERAITTPVRRRSNRISTPT